MSLLTSLSSLACLASACFTALRSWPRARCLISLACLASGCSAALCSWSHMYRLSTLACLAVGCSVFGVELHSEGSSVTFSISISVELHGGVHHVNLH